MRHPWLSRKGWVLLVVSIVMTGLVILAFACGGEPL